MPGTDLIQLLAFVFLLILVAPRLGGLIARLFDGRPRTVRGPESWVYRLSGIDPNQEMTWKTYAAALMAFNLIGILIVFLLQTFQTLLPLNHQHLANPSWDLALNTAVSFVTNTDWQAYAGESSLSQLTQMLALATQNFFSAATGLAVAVTLARAIARRSAKTIGNFWTDLTRGILYLLLPASIVLAMVLVAEGVPQTFHAPAAIKTVEGEIQTLPLGPVASQVAIKQLGTNGGGYFNANSAHPFENPTPLTNFLEMFSIFLFPAALVFAFGAIVNARKHAWVVFGVMLSIFLVFVAVALYSEYAFNPVIGKAALMEGKETRFGIFGSVFFAMITTSASCGAVNALHSSLSPLAGGIAMFNMHLGEVIFGGVGAGLYGMLLFILLTVFLAGLMVGRSPEYLGKRIEAREMSMVIWAVLAPSIAILVGTALSIVLPDGLKGLANSGPHGFSEVFYAFTSAAANNGSAFAGLAANSVYFNLMLALAMFVGRFAIILPVLHIAGSLAAKKYAPPGPGTFEVDTPLFGFLLAGVLLIVGGLTFIPGLALGPIIEQLLQQLGRAS